MTNLSIDSHSTRTGVRTLIDGRPGEHPRRGEASRDRLRAGSAARIGGLDGLRAIAVSLVLIYHLWPNVLPGGFLGVDVFFVISGFLITTLLLSEYRRHGKLRLADFWRRRARRLLPALGLVLLVCTSAAALVGGDLLVNLGAQVLGAALFAANWVYIGLGSDYFAQDNPELFRNTWSLAIEEQFYLVLPLTLLFALRMRSRWTRVLFYGLFGVASATWMISLSFQGAPATRIYFGTDTHVFGLLLGVALACGLEGASTRASRIRGEDQGLDLPAQLALFVLGAAGIAVLLLLAFTLREGSPESFTWGFQVATLAMLLTVWAASRPGAWLGRALDVRPLRWVGERSYGLYLWHWPILVIVAALGAPAGASSWSVPVLALLLTVPCAALSYRYIEQPVRRLGLRRSLGLLFRPARLRGRPLLIGVSLLAILAVTLPTSAVAIANAPATSSSADAIARGEAALAGQSGRVIERPADGGGSEAVGGERQPGDAASTTETEAGDSELAGGPGDGWSSQPKFEAPLPAPIEGWEIFAVGDSVMLASAPELGAAFPDIWIDASVSRGLGVGVGIVQDLAAQQQLRSVLVVGLGTNGPIENTDLDALLKAADGRRIVLVNAHADRWWVPEVNQQLAAFAEAHRGVTLADWDGAIAKVPGGLAGDDIHPNPSGGEAYAAAVQTALDELRERGEQPKRTR